jgi:hypothetical protein
MKTRAIKMLVSSLAFATLISAPALAQSSRHWRSDQQVTPHHPNDAIVRGKVVGRDPDPFIRSQIERGYWLQGSQD